MTDPITVIPHKIQNISNVYTGPPVPEITVGVRLGITSIVLPLVISDNGHGCIRIRLGSFLSVDRFHSTYSSGGGAGKEYQCRGLRRWAKIVG